MKNWLLLEGWVVTREPLFVVMRLDMGCDGLNWDGVAVWLGEKQVVEEGMVGSFSLGDRVTAGIVVTSCADNNTSSASAPTSL